MKSERGIILVAVLGALALFAALASATAWLARSGVQAGLSEQLALERDALEDSAYAITALHLMSAALARWSADDRPYALEIAGRSLQVNAQATSGLVNVNHADKPLLQGLFAQFAATGAQAEALAVEVIELRKLGPIDSLEAVQPAFAAKGVSLAPVRPFMAVHGTSQVLDPATAPLTVLLAIPGMGLPDAEFIISGRESGRLNSAAVEALISRFRPWLFGKDEGIYRLSLKVAAAPRDGAWRNMAVVRIDPAQAPPMRFIELGWPEDDE